MKEEIEAQQNGFTLIVRVYTAGIVIIVPTLIFFAVVAIHFLMKHW
jgi:hypothetical protein